MARRHLALKGWADELFELSTTNDTDDLAEFSHSR